VVCNVSLGKRKEVRYYDVICPPDLHLLNLDQYLGFKHSAYQNDESWPLLDYVNHGSDTGDRKSNLCSSTNNTIPSPIPFNVSIDVFKLTSSNSIRLKRYHNPKVYLCISRYLPHNTMVAIPGVFAKPGTFAMPSAIAGPGSFALPGSIALPGSYSLLAQVVGMTVITIRRQAQDQAYGPPIFGR
jgi:hypothetical protein